MKFNEIIEKLAFDEPLTIDDLTYIHEHKEEFEDFIKFLSALGLTGKK